MITSVPSEKDLAFISFEDNPDLFIIILYRHYLTLG